jgi:enediyne biosynthesis protein E4
MVGGGAATFDCSGDGFPDLFLSGGAGPSALYLNRSPQGGALAFEKTDAVTLDGVLGAYPLDIDSDGVLDLVVLRLGENRLLRGLGDCRFEDATDSLGLRRRRCLVHRLCRDLGEGADLAHARHRQLRRPQGRGLPLGVLHRQLAAPARGAAFRPADPADAVLLRAVDAVHRLEPVRPPSLRVSNDREYYKGGQEQMWHLEPGQPPRLYTEADDGWKRLRIWGMGIASADVNLDGYPDYYLTSMADNKLQVLKDPSTGLPDYADIAFKSGITAHRPYTGGDSNLRPPGIRNSRT